MFYIEFNWQPPSFVSQIQTVIINICDQLDCIWDCLGEPSLGLSLRTLTEKGRTHPDRGSGVGASVGLKQEGGLKPGEWQQSFLPASRLSSIWPVDPSSCHCAIPNSMGQSNPFPCQGLGHKINKQKHNTYKHPSIHSSISALAFWQNWSLSIAQSVLLKLALGISEFQLPGWDDWHRFPLSSLILPPLHEARHFIYYLPEHSLRISTWKSQSMSYNHF